MRQFAPKTIRENENLITREQGDSKTGGRFSSGMFNDIPVIPDDAIAYSSGYIPFDRKLVPSGGCKVWSSTTAPSGNYNGSYLLKKSNQVLHHFGASLYISDVLMSTYTPCYCISSRCLSDSISHIEEQGEYALLFCTGNVFDGGIFRIDLTGGPVLYWKCNGAIPETRITDTLFNPKKPYVYKYTYTAAMILGQDRLSVKPKYETGSCKIDSKYIDCGTVSNDRPVGLEAIGVTYDIITGTPIGGADTPSYWAGMLNAQFKIPIDGVTYNVPVDCYGVTSMTELAQRIQLALRAFNEYITFEYSIAPGDTEGHFTVTNPVLGGTLGYVTAGNFGTDIEPFLNLSSGYSTKTSPFFYKHLSVKTLFVPTNPLNGKTEKQITHLPVYRTLDVGENGINPQTGEGNNEEQFIWVADVPAARVFIASLTVTSEAAPFKYLVTASYGTFEKGDIGAKLRFMEGIEVEITDVAEGTATAWVDYDDTVDLSEQPCAIGGDGLLGKQIRVMTLQQTGTVLQNLAGDPFVSSDVGRIVFLPNYKYLHITEFVSGSRVNVAESGSFYGFPGAIEPKCRAWSDTINDDTFRSRIVDLTLQQRFNEPLPECDLGVLAAGFLFVAAKGENSFYYQQVYFGKEYLLGFYNPRQAWQVKDKIQAISAFPQVFFVYCKHSSRGISFKNTVTVDVNSTIQILVLYDESLVDNENGALSSFGIVRLPNGQDWVLTNEPGVKICDGAAFSDNLAKDRCQKLLRQLRSDVTAGYDPLHGVSIYGKRGVEPDPIPEPEPE